VTVHPKSYFAELDHDVTLNLPATVDTSIRLLLNDHPIHP